MTRTNSYLRTLDVFDRLDKLFLDFYEEHGYSPDRVQLSDDDYRTIIDGLRNSPFDTSRDIDSKLPQTTTFRGIEVVRGDVTKLYRVSPVPEKLLWQPPGSSMDSA